MIEANSNFIPEIFVVKVGSSLVTQGGSGVHLPTLSLSGHTRLLPSMQWVTN